MTGISERIKGALKHPNVQAFLHVIRHGESSQTDSAYRMHYGGSLFDDLKRHPNVVIRIPGKSPSTAAGAYQFLYRTWEECREALDLPDFSPASQDLAAVFLVWRRHALDDVLAGRVKQAILKCNREWASFPESPYGQSRHSMQDYVNVYTEYGGMFEPVSSVDITLPDPIEAPKDPPKEKSKMVAPWLLSLLPGLMDAVPKIAELFKGKSKVAERNVKAVETVFNVAKTALNAHNEQEVVEKLQANPEAVSIVTKAVEENWHLLTQEVGGGIAAARAFDISFSGGDMWRSPSWWLLVLLIPLVYMITASLIGILGEVDWPSEFRAALLSSIATGIIFGAIGYYWGSVTSRNRMPAQAGEK